MNIKEKDMRKNVRIENTSRFEVRTWLDAYLELEQYSGSDWRCITSTRVHKYRRERELRNGATHKYTLCWTDVS